MKKLLFICACALFLAAGANVKADGVVDKVFLYIPNRIIDLFDVFTINVGVGPTVRFDLRATRALQFGGGISATAKAIKDYNRQYGGALENGWNWQFTSIGAEDTERTKTSRWVKEYWEHYEGFCSPEQRIYNFWEGARDYWAIGFSLGVGVAEVDFYLHPVEIIDFFTSCLFIDIKGDDLTFESFE